MQKEFFTLVLEICSPPKNEDLTSMDYYNDNGLPDELFFRLFEKFDVAVEQANWDDIYLTSYLDNAHGKRACFSVRASHKPVDESQVRRNFWLCILISIQKKNRRVIPQLILIRTLPYALTDKWDHRNTLLGIIHSGTPCVNQARAIWLNELERPLMFSGM